LNASDKKQTKDGSENAKSIIFWGDSDCADFDKLVQVAVGLIDL